MKEAEKKKKLKSLQLLSAIGFSGAVHHGLHLLKTNEVVYPVGKNVGLWMWKVNNNSMDAASALPRKEKIRNQENDQMVNEMSNLSRHHDLLKGHKSQIVALSVSQSADIIASAENALVREWATVIIWSACERKEIGRHSAHREEVTDVAVSSNGKYVLSLGGEEDRKLIVWDTEIRKPICSMLSCEVGAGVPKILCSSPVTPTVLGIGGRRILKVFSFDEKSQALLPFSVNLGIVERNYTDLKIDCREEFIYGSTTTGDVVKVRLNLQKGKVSSAVPVLVAIMAPRPLNKCHEKGVLRQPLPAVTTMCLLPDGDLIVGDSTGVIRGFAQVAPDREKHFGASTEDSTFAALPARAHGSIKIVRPKDPTRPLLKQLWSLKVDSPITSLSIRGKSMVVGTEESEIHELFMGSFEEFQIMIEEPLPNSAKNFRHKSAKNYREKQFIKHKPTNTNSIMINASARKSSANKEAENPSNIGRLGDSRQKDTDEVRRLEFHMPPSRLVSSCPSGALYDIAFPRDISDLVVTAGDFGIQVWNVRTLQDLLKVVIPGIICRCCVVSSDLSTIVTGWIDGRIRGVGAESGVLKWVIEDAHHKSVNSIVSHGNDFIISGGADGRVRSWRLSASSRPTLEFSMREHRGEVTSVTLDQEETCLLSCGADGQSILWTVPSLERLFCMKADAVFLGGSILLRQEVVTVGSDGSVLIWDRSDGSLLADLKVSRRPVTAIDVTKDDKLLVTAEENGTIKVWNWVKGRVIYEGLGHSGPNTRVKLSPDGEIAVSAGVDGSVFIWKTPVIKI